MLRSDCIALVKSIHPRTDIDTFLKVFNSLADRNSLAVEFLQARRGTRLKGRNYAALYASPDFVFARDKQVASLSPGRTLPRYTLLAEILDGHLANLRSLAARLEPIDRETAKQVWAIAKGERPLKGIFFTVAFAGKRVKLSMIQSSDLAEMANLYFQSAKNFGRHFMLSKLVELNAPGMLIRAALGHGRSGAEVFGAAMGVSPARACRELKKLLQGIVSKLSLESWPSLQRPKSPEDLPPSRMPRRLKRLGNRQAEEYLRSLDEPRFKSKLMAESSAMDHWSLPSHRLVHILRSALADGRTTPSYWSAILACLVVFDGQISTGALRAAWDALHQNAYRLGTISVLEVCQPTGSTFPLFLQPTSCIYFNASLNLPKPKFEEAIREVGSWLRLICPSQAWSENPVKCIELLFAFTERWMRIEIEPFLCTAASEEFGAASVTLSSIARMAWNRPRIWDGSVIDCSPLRRRSTEPKLEEELDEIGRIVSNIGTSRNRHGEERKRHSLLKKEITTWREAHGTPSPLANGICKWLLAESLTSGKQMLEVSSLATYLSKIQPGVLRLAEDLGQSCGFEDFEPENWQQLMTEVESNHADEPLKQQRSALRRLAVYFRNCGFPVPNSLFANVDSADDVMHVVSRSSSIYISLAESNTVRARLVNRFSDDPLLAAKSGAKVTLLENRPFRNAEANRVGILDLDDRLQCVFIVTSGFSHTKTKASVRTVLLTTSTFQELSSLRDRIRIAYPDAEFLFLDSPPSALHADMDLIDAEFGRELVYVTGEAFAHIHCLRGSSNARSIEPRIEDLVKALANGAQCLEASRSIISDDWLKVVRSARQAGHGSDLSNLRYYLAIWPILMFLSLRATLQQVSPGDELSKLVEDWKTPAAMHMAILRAKRKSIDPIVEWNVFASKLTRIVQLESLEAKLETDPISIVSASGRTYGPQVEPEAREIWYVMLRDLNFPPSTAQDFARVPESMIPRLENAFRQGYAAERRASLDGNIPPMKTNLVRAQLKAPRGKAIVSAVAGCNDIRALSRIICALNGMTAIDYGMSPLRDPLDKDFIVRDLLDRIELARKILPPEFTLSVLLLGESPDPRLAISVNRVDPAIVTKSSDRRSDFGYRFRIVAREPAKRGPRQDGENSRMLLTACQARVAILNTTGKENQNAGQ